MRSFTLLSMVVVLAICYLLYFRSAQSGDNGATAQINSGEHAGNDVYKADMDQARAAARMMAKGREESDAH